MMHEQKTWNASKVRSAIILLLRKHPCTQHAISQTDIGMPVGCLHREIFVRGASLLESHGAFFNVQIHDEGPAASHVSFCVPADVVERLLSKKSKTIVGKAVQRKTRPPRT